MKPMKNILAKLTWTIAVGSGCLLGITGCDSGVGMTKTREKFPTADIASIPGHKYEWIVRETNNAVWWVYDNGMDRQSAMMLKPAQ